MVVGVVVWELHSGREHLALVSGRPASGSVAGGSVVNVHHDHRPCVGGGWCCPWFYEQHALFGVSVEGRMVDALAAGADEGRGNLR